ncbi:MAG: TRAP transporter large permease subunit, partial [Acetobacteraceae bacterium]
RDPARYTDTQPFSLPRLRTAFVQAIPALVLPVIIVGGIVGGVVTPTEAGVLAVAAGLAIDLLIYKELKLSALPDLMLRTVGISAAVMIIVGTSSIFAWLVAIQNVPEMIAGWFDAAGGSQVLFLLMVNLLMLFVGMCFEEISALLILMPVLMPVAIKLGIDPLHFGLIMSINLSIGLVAPPYGICMFVACAVARRPVGAVARVIWIPLIPLVLVLMLCTYVPSVVLWLPRALL